MKRLFTLSLLFIGITISYLSQAAVYYVKETATGAGLGTDWDNASANLQEMINAASSGDQIWVAAGTYKPVLLLPGGASAKDASFLLKDGVEIYGGFAGTESLLSERNVLSNITILSGDIGTTGDVSDNVHHVVVSAGNASSAKLDGFTITGGNANGSGTLSVNSNTIPRYSGGGIALVGSSAVFDNLIITQNMCYGTSANGGGIYSTAGGAATISNSTISNNTSDATGTNNGTSGALWIAGSSTLANTMKLNNVVISGNSSKNSAGAVYIQNYASPEFTNVSVLNNTSGLNGGALFITGTGTAYITSPKFTDCTFSGNESTGGRSGGVYASSYSSSEFVNTTFTNNKSDSLGGAFYVLGTTTSPTIVKFTDCSFTDNEAAQAGGALYVSTYASAEFDNVDFSDNTAGTVGGAIYTVGASAYINSPTFTDCNFSGNSSTGSGGAVYFANYSSPVLTNTVFSENTSNGTGGAFFVVGASATAFNTFSLDGVKFIKNRGTTGGAGYVSSYTNAIFKNVTFLENTATASSGGALFLYCVSSSANPTNVEITNGVFYNNEATLSSSTSDLGGGAVCASTNTDSYFTNCTFYSNKATTRNGGAINIVASAKSVSVVNSILFGNTAGNFGDDIFNAGEASILTLRYSLTQDAGISGIDGMEVGSDPFFLSTDPNDANFLRLNPIEDSPTIDLGDNSYVSGIATDLAGNVRIYNGTVDMGAYEYPGTLPVSLTDFTVKKHVGNTVLLSWITASESNNAGFIVERSINGTDYTELSKVLPAGDGTAQQNYSFTDYSPVQGVNYYRLIQTDINGKQTIYGPKAVDIALDKESVVKLYPNPVKDNKLTIEFSGSDITKAELINITGKIVESITVTSGSNLYAIDFSKHSAGIYFLRVSNTEGSTVTKKIINP